MPYFSPRPFFSTFRISLFPPREITFPSLLASTARLRKATRQMTGPKKILEWAKGFRGRAKNCISIARERVEKALQYKYRDRRNLKRDMRSLWIQRINAGCRQHGVRCAVVQKKTPAHARAAQVLAVDTRPGGGEHHTEQEGAVTACCNGAGVFQGGPPRSIPS